MKKYKKVLVVIGVFIFLLAGYASIKFNAPGLFGMSESTGNYLAMIWLLITSFISMRWVYNLIYLK